MLVLTRKTNQGVTIITPSGESLHVVLVKQGGDKTRLGFDFPPDYRIVRDELLDQPEEAAA